MTDSGAEREAKRRWGPEARVWRDAGLYYVGFSYDNPLGSGLDWQSAFEAASRVNVDHRWRQIDLSLQALRRRLNDFESLLSISATGARRGDRLLASNKAMSVLNKAEKEMGRLKGMTIGLIRWTADGSEALPPTPGT